ncbi:MAG: hypothetical protein VSS75_022180 [Candidatus Parabeggiatoa sp.]|nr:hypothetical protein [Candidatus Parabeggiatoa sp.]
MDKLIMWIKSNSLAISLFLIIIGAFLVFYTNDYGILSKTISSIVDGEITEKVIYTLENRKPILSILSNIFLSLGFALFISAFFIRYIESDERKLFEDKLLSFQKNTAKDAIQSVFKKIIDKEFFSIIEKDLFNAKTIRKKANWQYDISEIEKGKLQLKRTIIYELHNVSSNTTSEHLQVKGNHNQHCKTEVISSKVRYPSGKEDPIGLTNADTDDKAFSCHEKEITINAGESIEVMLVFQQTFNNYIYEVHLTRHPIIGLEITVNFPSNYKFELFSSFSNKEYLRINELGKKVYIVRGAIFKGQGIEFICEKQQQNT